MALLAAFFAAPEAFAGTTEQKEIEDHYLEEVQRNGSLYKTSPVTHIVPKNKEITFALDAKRINLQLDGSGLESKYGHNDSDISLEGYSVTPYVALSLKRIGLGFSADAGAKNYVYKDGDSNEQQKSKLDYRAIGIYAYLLPFSNTPNWLTTSIVLGAKSYTASHKVSNMVNGDPSGRDYQKYNYTTMSYLAGTLLDFHFLKRFSIVPWLDYTYTNISQLNDAAKDKKYAGSNGYFLAREGELFWRARPQTEYGIDLVVRFDLLSVHLGDLLAPLAYQSDDHVIKDRSVQLSVSADMKGD
jgi:hypothetical protein